MKTVRNTLTLGLLLGLCASASAAPWVYRGSLQDGGAPANGKYDVRVTLVNEAGSPLTQAVTLYSVDVQKGSFQTQVDFGMEISTLPNAKLKTEVQQGSSGFVQLGEPKAIEGGLAECWDRDGNTGPLTSIIGTTDVAINNVVLRNGAAGNLYLRSNRAVEQAESAADGDSAAAWGASKAAANFSFTVARGEVLPSGASSFVYSDLFSNLPGAVSGAPGEFLVRATGGIGFQANPEGADVAIGNRGAGNTRLLIRNTNAADESIISFLTGTNGSEFGDIGFRYSNGGFFINAQTLDGGRNRLEIFGGTGGAAVVTNGGAFQNASSRAFKEGFQAVNATEILAKVMSLPMTTWTYKNSGDEGTHMGPMAEDFKEIFNLSGDGKGISTVDANGVALVAIQGLNEKLTAAEQENAALKARLDAIEARLQQ